ncbi:hypothetical protein BHE74_00052317 [Ensete ventricosum]|nr:hypothetical protein BHE74_00052317 [Ensete ventricosum]
MRFGGARSPFSLLWRKILVRVELRVVVGGLERLKSARSSSLTTPRQVLGLFGSGMLPLLALSDDQGLNCDGMIRPLHHFVDYD